MTGKMVTHFSFGSLFPSHGFSISPFFTRREWKYLCPRVSKLRPTALESPKLEGGLDAAGVPNGFRPMLRCEDCDSTLSSPKGFFSVFSVFSVSGVPGRKGVGLAVESGDGATTP